MCDDNTNYIETINKVHGFLPNLNEMSMPIGILTFSVSENYKILDINDFLILELGYDNFSDLEHNNGYSLLSSIHPEDLISFKEYINSKENISNFKFRIRCKNYSFLWFKSLGIKQTKLENNIIITCVCINISEYINLQNLMVEAENKIDTIKFKMENALEKFPCRLHIFKLFDDYSIDYISDGFCQLCGYTRNEKEKNYNNRYFMLLYEDDIQMYKDTLYELSEYPHKKKIEYRIKDKNGNLFWVLDFIKSVRTSDGKMRAYSSIVEIDKWQKTFPVLGKVADSLPYGIITCEYYSDERTLKIQFFNKTICELLSCSPEDIEKLNIEDLKNFISEYDLERIYKDISSKVINDNEINYEFRIYRDLSEHLIYMKAKIIKVSQHVFLINAIFLDISKKV